MHQPRAPAALVEIVEEVEEMEEVEEVEEPPDKEEIHQPEEMVPSKAALHQSSKEKEVKALNFS